MFATVPGLCPSRNNASNGTRGEQSFRTWSSNLEIEIFLTFEKKQQFRTARKEEEGEEEEEEEEKKGKRDESFWRKLNNGKLRTKRRKGQRERRGATRAEREREAVLSFQVFWLNLFCRFASWRAERETREERDRSNLVFSSFGFRIEPSEAPGGKKSSERGNCDSFCARWLSLTSLIKGKFHLTFG